MSDAICYNNYITLKHQATGRFLSSNDEHYESGSGQKKVFSSGDNMGEESTWLVLPPIGSEEEPGYEVGFEDKIRLRLVSTNANLHSHDIESPVSGQNEVSCFGNNEESDENDLWEVIKYNDEDDQGYENPDLWHVGQPVKLRHVQTGRNLHSHEICLFEDKNEVTAANENDENDAWVAEV